MYTKEFLKSQLKEMGLKPTDTVFVHSSLKAIGPVEGRGDGVLDAFLEYFSEGTVAFPSHTYEWVHQSGVYDPARDPSCVGMLSNLALKRENGHRSLHPDHSCVAFGPGAEDLIAGDDGAVTPLPRNGSMGKLIDRKGIILMIGCGARHNTFLHCVEEIENVPDRIAEYTIPIRVVQPDGSEKEYAFHPHHCSRGQGVSEHYDRAVPGLLACGAMWVGLFGHALVFAERADKVYEHMAEELRRNPGLFDPEVE